MMGIEKEETTAAIEAAKQVFLRFGSTRGLNQTLLLLALAYLARLDREFAWAYGFEMVLTSLLTLCSLHRRPHSGQREVNP